MNFLNMKCFVSWVIRRYVPEENVVSIFTIEEEVKLKITKSKARP